MICGDAREWDIKDPVSANYIGIFVSRNFNVRYMDPAKIHQSCLT